MPDTILALTDARLTLAGNAGPVAILKGITLSIHRGETIGLVGPSATVLAALATITLAYVTCTELGKRALLGRLTRRHDARTGVELGRSATDGSGILG